MPEGPGRRAAQARRTERLGPGLRLRVELRSPRPQPSGGNGRTPVRDHWQEGQGDGADSRSRERGQV
eukprot:993492-Heterocapsa_arctica.AAC.1